MLGGSKVGPVSKTLPNNTQQDADGYDATCNIQKCWELFANNVASTCKGLYIKRFAISINIFLPMPFTSLLRSFRNVPFPVSRNGVGVSPEVWNK